MFKKIKRWLIWLFSRRVQEAINNGADYDEVEKIVDDEINNTKRRAKK